MSSCYERHFDVQGRLSRICWGYTRLGVWYDVGPLYVLYEGTQRSENKIFLFLGETNRPQVIACWFGAAPV